MKNRLTQRFAQLFRVKRLIKVATHVRPSSCRLVISYDDQGNRILPLEERHFLNRM